MNNANVYYVYVYLDPRKLGQFSCGEVSFLFEPFYVGYGQKDRYLQHLKQINQKHKKPDNPHKINKIKSIIKSGTNPFIIKYKENLSFSEANLIEINLIASIGRYDLKTGPLTNLTGGGPGTPRILITDEHRQKMSVITSGTNNGMFGKKHSNKAKALIASKATGRKLTQIQKDYRKTRMPLVNPFKGRHHSEQTKLILSEKSRKIFLNRSPEDQKIINSKNSLANKGRRHSQEACSKISANRKNQFPPTAKRFLIISPENIEFIVHGELKKFVLEHNLSISLFRRFINKGVIIAKQSKQSDSVKNSIGWQIKDYILD